MIHQSLIDDDSLWAIFCYLEGMQKTESIGSICEKLEVSKDKVLHVVSLLSSLNVSYEVDANDAVIPPIEKPIIKFDLKLSEWIALQSHFPAIDFYKENASHKTLVNKLSEIENQNSQYDFFQSKEIHIEDVLHILEVDDEASFDFDLSHIKTAIAHKASLELISTDDQVLQVYPHRLVMLERELCIIAEVIDDRTLTYISCEQISGIQEFDSSYEPQFNQLEINNFIQGVRKLSDGEIRLVLKIKDPNIELDPPFQFMGKPFVALNWQGERIWGVTVEPNDMLYGWVAELGDKVEIIDPPAFKQEFLDYLENTLKKAG